jgi:hypothetical protein
VYVFRGPGPDFTERDRAVLTLLRLHLHQACLDAEQRRHPVPRLWLFRGPGRDFTERDRAVLTLLRPHLRQA